MGRDRDIEQEATEGAQEHLRQPQDKRLEGDDTPKGETQQEDMTR